MQPYFDPTRKTTSKTKMEDDLKKNGRRPKKKGRQHLKKMEDNIKKKGRQTKKNGIRHQQKIKKWKTTYKKMEDKLKNY